MKKFLLLILISKHLFSYDSHCSNKCVTLQILTINAKMRQLEKTIEELKYRNHILKKQIRKLGGKHIDFNKEREEAINKFKIQISDKK